MALKDDIERVMREPVMSDGAYRRAVVGLLDEINRKLPKPKKKAAKKAKGEAVDLVEKKSKRRYVRRETA